MPEPTTPPETPDDDRGHRPATKVKGEWATRHCPFCGEVDETMFFAFGEISCCWWCIATAINTINIPSVEQ